MLRKVYTKFHYVFAMDCTDFNGLILCGGGFMGKICIFVLKQFAGSDWKDVVSGLAVEQSC